MVGGAVVEACSSTQQPRSLSLPPLVGVWHPGSQQAQVWDAAVAPQLLQQPSVL